jgi:hypothetical protein
MGVRRLALISLDPVLETTYPIRQELLRRQHCRGSGEKRWVGATFLIV